jgi:hypothetical protein
MYAMIAAPAPEHWATLLDALEESHRQLLARSQALGEQLESPPDSGPEPRPGRAGGLPERFAPAEWAALREQVRRNTRVLERLAPRLEELRALVDALPAAARAHDSGGPVRAG